MTNLGHDIGVLLPRALWGIPVVLVIITIVLARGRTRRQRIRALGLSTPNVREISSYSIFLPALLLVVACLRPYWGSQEIEIAVHGDDYMFLVDVSRSMYTRDVAPSRIGLAKRKLKDLLHEFQKTGAPHRYGITLFAGASYLFCPLTSDTAVVDQFITTIDPAMVTSVGSNLEAGVTTTLERFEATGVKNGRILLVSDGEDDSLALERVANLLRERGVRMDVLGVGTPEGKEIEAEDGRFVVNQSGEAVHSSLNERSLRALAEAGSGIYVRATLHDRDLRAIVSSSVTLIGNANNETRRLRSYAELGPMLVLLALIGVLIMALFPRLGQLLWVFLVVAYLPGVASATPEDSPDPPSSPRYAYELYQRGDFAQSVRVFEKALAADPHNRDVKQGLASALFKSGSFAKAAEIFEQLASSSPDGRSFFENEYNRGNALLSLGRYSEAIKAYTRALQVKPDDERAAHNKRVAESLEEQRRRAPPTPTPAPSPTPTPSTTSTPPPQAQSSSSSSTPQTDPSGSTSSQSWSTDSSATSTSETSQVSSPPAAAASSSAEADDSTPPSSEGSFGSSQERLKEALDDGGEVDSSARTQQQREAGTESEKQLSLSEAQAWLESLPESPLLIRRQLGGVRNGGQSW